MITLADLARGVVQSRNGAYVYVRLDGGVVREVYDNEIVADDEPRYTITEAGRAMLRDAQQGVE